MKETHHVTNNGIDALVDTILKCVDGKQQGDAVVALFAATSRIMQGEQPWAKEVKYVQDMLDYSSTIMDTEGRPN